eukprot:2030637-Pyramimonas_sp.AAC.1
MDPMDAKGYRWMLRAIGWTVRASVWMLRATWWTVRATPWHGTNTKKGSYEADRFRDTGSFVGWAALGSSVVQRPARCRRSSRVHCPS